MSRPPILRAPPFPWVKPDVAAVSRSRARSADASDPARIDRLADAIRTARVGGAFWAPPAEPLAPGTLLVRAADAATAGALLREHATGKYVALVGPAGCDRWGLDVARIIVGEVDPWSLLAPGIRLAAGEHDEWRILATIAGAAVTGPAPTPDALSRALTDEVAYRDPFSGAAADAEATVALLADWRRTLDANRAVAACAGMAWWKKRHIADFLWTGRQRDLAFADNGAAALAIAAERGGALAVWPSRVTASLLEDAAEKRVPIVRVEDGFIRSVGLGADLLPPFSIVADSRGIYYDPDPPSDIEHLIETADITPATVARAGRLVETIVARGISKYGSVAPTAPAAPRARRTVLVAGQVEDDLSVRRGGAGVAGNLDLLRRARSAEPDALVLFKPHPDVDAGHRVGRIADAVALTIADEVVRGEPIQALLARVDAVHVLTSLVGFEALLRGLETHVHGQPFYAGWGLTRDHGPALPRRARRRSLGELAAAVLILYPRYRDPVTGLPCPPEILLARFGAGWKPRPGLVVFARRLQGRLFRLLGKTTG